MTIQITVIGMNQVGLSLGLALAEHKDKVFRCAHDPVPARMKQVATAASFDKLYYNLPEAVREADVVVLSLPLDQVAETLKRMAEHLKPEVVVIDTSPSRVSTAALAKKLLPADRFFVSMMPVINGTLMSEEALTPNADYFKNTDMVISTEHGTNPEAVDLVTDLTRLLGARVYFVDPLEADGICARVDLLPKLTSVALLLSTIGQPGWQDARKVASGAYQQGASALDFIEEIEQPSAGFLANKANAISSLNTMIESLIRIKGLIESEDHKGLDELLGDLRDDHAEWLAHRVSGDWESADQGDKAENKGILSRLFNLRGKAR